MTGNERNAAIDLKQVQAESTEHQALTSALERAQAGSDGFERQFVASGCGKCPVKPSV